MSKKCTVGKCALCNRENIELMQSHIIPKLVYTRVKTYQNSRFRNFLNFNQLYQDGEKKPMLCSDCEKYFSKYEVKFTNQFLDKYLTLNDQTMPLQYDEIRNYIITVSWRILYDDLFVYNSFSDTHARNTYEIFEKRLRKYLNQMRNDGVQIHTDDTANENRELQPKSLGEAIALCEKTMLDSTIESLENIEAYIFTLKELGYSDRIIKPLDLFITGYSYNSSDHKQYVVFSLYKGLIIATVFWNDRAIFIPSNIKELLGSRQNKSALKSSLKKEIDCIVEQIEKAYPKNQEILNTNSTREKLERRYKNEKKLR